MFKMKIKKEKLGFIEGWLSAIINVLLFGAKLWVGMITGSVAIIADAWHTLSDTLTSGVVIFGFWIAKKPADKEHPFGHGRAELISAIVISILLATVGFNFIVESIDQLRIKKAVDYDLTVVIVFLFSIVLKEGLAQFAFWAGRKIDAKSLIADGWHHRSDAIASGLIIIGAILGRYFWWIDGILGLIVSALILKAAWDIFRDSSSSIMGESINPDLENRLKNLAYDTLGRLCDVHHIHLHRYGNHKEITLHLGLPTIFLASEVNKLVHQLEDAIYKEFKMQATIHADDSSLYK
jgi:cation diffusion facilitator family transporter